MAREFPNSLTSDSTSITEALEIYGRKVSGGSWMLKEEIRVSLTRHSELIALLAKIGAARGHDIWIGQREQRETVMGLVEEIKLRDLVTAKPGALKALKGVSNARPVLDMDLLWLDGSQVIRAFEVECTTTMTSGLQRGSNLPAEVPKTMVIPEERENDFERKMKSPLFSERYAKDNWTLAYFNALRDAFAKSNGKTDLESVLGIKKPAASCRRKADSAESQSLFELPECQTASAAHVMKDDTAE